MGKRPLCFILIITLGFIGFIPTMIEATDWLVPGSGVRHITKIDSMTVEIDVKAMYDARIYQGFKELNSIELQIMRNKAGHSDYSPGFSLWPSVSLYDSVFVTIFDETSLDTTHVFSNMPVTQSVMNAKFYSIIDSSQTASEMTFPVPVKNSYNKMRFKLLVLGGYEPKSPVTIYAKPNYQR